jgi:peroxin-6
MQGANSELNHRKRRRRRVDRPAVSARLVIDDHLKGDVGVLSEDLYSELFPKPRGQNGEWGLPPMVS